MALLPDVAERNHRLGEMEGGRVVQADALAEVGKADAFAMARDLFQDGKGAAERLHAAAGAFPGLIVDGRLVRPHQPRNRRLAWRDRLFADLLAGLLVRLGLGARFHSVPLRPNAADPIQPVPTGEWPPAAAEGRFTPYHNSN